MDPITHLALVRDRMIDLQRTADQVRREREARASATDTTPSPLSRPAAVRGSPTGARSTTSPAEHAT